MQALVNGHLLDGTGCRLDAAVVLFDHGRIHTVGPQTEVSVPEDATRIDVSGGWILPGLIDGHMHVTGMPGLLDSVGHVQHNVQAVGKLAACLKHGTTTVANASGCPENMPLADAIDEGRFPDCARLLVEGVVSATGGHVRGRQADGPWDVRRAVREMALARVHVIKTCASGGFQWAHESLDHEDYSEEELCALVAQAHARHLRVHVHAHAQPGIGNAVRAGCDVILHGALMHEDALEMLAGSSSWYMPTLHITSEQIWGPDRLPQHMRERMKQACPIHREAVRKAVAMGIPIAVGTDGGPGAVLHELEELVACGMTPTQAVEAATRVTADCLGMLERSGTIEPGKAADMIVVADSPLDDIRNLTAPGAIQMVFRDGVRLRSG